MASEKKYAETPMMKQFYTFKAKYPDAMLLFRVGDFYEMFGEDAIKSSEILGITLTHRVNGAASFVELAGFPHHAIETYLPKLVRAGQRVAVCDQLEDPKQAKGVVKRGITELVTPGVTINDNVLENKENNFLACVNLTPAGAGVGVGVGVAFLDVSTGEFLAAEGSLAYVDKLLTNFAPKEVLFEKGKEEAFVEAFGARHYTYKLDEWAFAQEATRDKLLTHFQVPSLKGFGVDELKNGVTAAGAILFYLELTQHTQVKHIAQLARLDEDRYVWLDKFTVRNLELFSSTGEGARTLLSCLDRTLSPMGGRLLRRWISLPLKEIQQINARLDIVEQFIGHKTLADGVAGHVREVGDLERIISKAAVGRINPRELVQLARALSAVEQIKALCAEADEKNFVRIAEQLNPCRSIREAIEKQILPEPAAQLGRGAIVANGVSAELDELREITRGGKEYLLKIQQREAERTGIPSLKISFNNVFGYYIEVRNTHKSKVPPEWIRKQTITSAERYITEEIKVYEEKILGAEDKILALEQQVVSALVVSLLEYVAPIQHNATLVAQLDCLLCFAGIAAERRYCRPSLTSQNALTIRQGRHPVIELLLPPGEAYVANDVTLNDVDQQIIILTGPNMAGKSALLRQTALIVLMAQMGCYVPAAEAEVGVVDKIFTRVGASDNISQGESTFMVEMQEAASILNNLAGQSLILLDEVGRGTSTYDGISIARAMVEYIHDHPTSKAKTLFATHYHELNELEESFTRIKNYNIAIKEAGNKVIFLRKLVRGGSAHSFGIHVAQMAGMPKSVVERAGILLKELEQKGAASLSKGAAGKKSPQKVRDEGMQLSFFQLDDPVLSQIRSQIRATDVNSLTPIEALNKLSEIKKLTGL
ncbi:MAG: DNA mismatch repair protein MutS [Prevotellaceae bacterium]|jgi:DNA mismatch repair protein MutS|nr:DNA mismatch repair protein MutS [Prevotellaceae bacterium]